MFRDALESIGRGLARLARNPQWRVTSLERRAFANRRLGIRLQTKARLETNKRKKQRLYERSARAFARSLAQDERALELAERYGLNQ